jgi:hypothetical protein
MSDLVMPKGGLQGPDGRISAAGHNYLARLGNRIEDKPAGTAEEFLAGGQPLVRATAILQTMEAATSSGANIFTPDLGSRFDFIRTLTGVTVVTFPSHVPENSLPFYSVLFIQDGNGGWPLSFGAGFQGEAPTILDGARDKNLIGFKVLSRGPDTFTAWTVKGIEFSA